MANSSEVLGRGAEGHCDHGLRKQISGVRSHDMDTQDSIGLGLGQHLGQAVRLAYCLSPTVSDERESSDLERHTGRF